ncbi:MAG: UDP-N-acetylmuramate dehydrogenase [Eubacteriales bacterium]|nr:UDP-N-acetylmuramate dehydrogenase [Eubacteriales bacterium]
MTDKYSALLTLAEEYNREHEDPIEIKQNEPMSRHTSFKIGGNADLYIIPHDMDALIETVRILKETETKRYFLGNATNVLFDDAGFRGAVVSLGNICAIKVIENRIIAEAGASLNLVCKTARDKELSGLEFAYGIPGSIGGAVFMNAGAYGGEMSQVVAQSTYFSLDDMTVHTIPLTAHEYGYRESVYRHNNWLVLSAVLELQKGEYDKINAAMNDYMSRRIDKQPLEYPSAGSVFKRYPGRYTGQMIEECGLKGYSIGGAQVSEKHAGFIVNKGGATSADVLALIEHIKNEVYKKFDCRIECEVIHVK